MARLAIVGSRDFANLDLVRAFIARLRVTTTVVSGGAPGVDRAAEAAANARELGTDIFPAEWDVHGRSAGMRRNEQMIATVDGLVAFWDGRSRGTAHAISVARARGIWLRVYGADGRSS
jgi:hypothetical protein